MYNRPKPILSIDALPKNKQILQFRNKFMKAEEQNDIVEECYAIASSIVQAQIIVALCFGEGTVEDDIREIIKKKKPESYKIILQNFSKIMDNFAKSKNSNAVKTLEANIREFGKNYLELKQNIISNISLQEAEPLFLKCVKESRYLYGTRIRQFNNQEIDRRKIRQQQTAQQSNQKGSTYLILDYKSTTFIIIATFRTRNQRYTLLGESQKNSSQQKQSKYSSSQSFQTQKLKLGLLNNQPNIDDQSSSNFCCCRCQLI